MSVWRALMLITHSYPTPTMGVVVVEPTPFAARRLDTLKANVTATLAIHGIEADMEQDGYLLILHPDEPVDAMYALGDVFGIESVCIADAAEKGFAALVDAVTSVGRDVLHKDEIFHVEVVGSAGGVVARDVEFAATAALLSELSSLNIRPSSRDYDRLIRVYVSDDNAYVCRLCREGSGGLPVGSNGSALCCIYDCISATAAYVLAEHGFYPSITAIYTDTGMLRGIAKSIGVIARMLGRKVIELRYTQCKGRADDSFSRRHYRLTLLASLLLDRLVADAGMPDRRSTKIALPLSTSLHDMEFISNVMDRVSSKGVMLPLMFSSNILRYQRVFGAGCAMEVRDVAKASCMVDREHVEEEVAECMANMRVLEVSVGPNMVHEIVDGVMKGEGGVSSSR